MQHNTLAAPPRIESLLYEYRCLLREGNHTNRIDEIETILGATHLPAYRMASSAARSLEERLEHHTAHQTFTIAWSGPWDLSDPIIRTQASGLYLLYGKRRYERRARVQYCGITEQYYIDRFRNQYYLDEITRDLAIWLGQITGVHTPERAQLLRAEHLIIHALQLPLNIQGTALLPPPTTVLSLWYDQIGRPRAAPYPDMPCVMSWDGAVWRNGHLAEWVDE